MIGLAQVRSPDRKQVGGSSVTQKYSRAVINPSLTQTRRPPMGSPCSSWTHDWPGTGPFSRSQAGRRLVGDPEVFQSRDKSFSNPDQKAADGIALLVMDP